MRRTAIVTLTFFAAAPLLAASKPRLSAPTKRACHAIRSYLRKAPAFDLLKGFGQVRLKDLATEYADRTGCQLSMEGKFTDDFNAAPDMDRFFVNEGWDRILPYSADGPGTSRLGYYKGPEDKGTFCLSDYESDAGLDADATGFQLKVVCVDARREVGADGEPRIK